MVAPVPFPSRTVQDVEAAIVAAELRLTARLLRVADREAADGDDGAIGSSVRAVACRLEPLRQERHRRLAHEEDRARLARPRAGDCRP